MREAKKLVAVGQRVRAGTTFQVLYFASDLRHLARVMETPTLAAKLGTTAHVSSLLQKARRLGLGANELETLAVQRGCRYYSTGSEPAGQLASEGQFSNEELAIALLSTALRYEPHSIRCGAAMLGASGNEPGRLARLAVMERCVAPVRYVAEAGKRFEPENRFWSALLEVLPPAPPPKPGVLPHPTRFVAMTGFTRRGPGLVTQWQRPRQSQKQQHDER